jgi:aspartyl-tRNA(Asn)/glutamyl-tRNA(Gln) amidotransferase subunit B
MSALDNYEIVVGLEVHVQLKTRTKMFCGCAYRFGAEPNTLTCQVCLGLPGALPVPNRAAIEAAMRAGLALSCRVADTLVFDRKQYFYPDLPKGYQISQAGSPLNAEGSLTFLVGGVEKTVRVARAHVEEDAGKNLHESGADASLVDLNRSGVPLLEIVSGPDLRSSEEAHAYLTELKLLLKTIEVSECDMEKGSLRCDVNVSIRPKGSKPFGVRVEPKNLNSFKAVARAIDDEAARQATILDGGGSLVEETRLWDDERGESRLMRRKESSPDYRYFPDPDLPPMRVPKEWVDRVRAETPELPKAKIARYTTNFGLSDYDANVLVGDPDVCRYFEETTALCGDAKQAANWITSELFGLMKGGVSIIDVAVRPSHIAEIVDLVRKGSVNVRTAREVLAKIYENPKPAAAYVAEMGAAQVSDKDALTAAVRRALEANAKAVADLKAGKEKAKGAIVGFVMRETKGRANPAVVDEILAELLRQV